MPKKLYSLYHILVCCQLSCCITLQLLNIQEAEPVEKKVYLMLSHFSSYNLAFVAYNYVMLKTFILKLPDPSPEHNIAPDLNSDNMII